MPATELLDVIQKSKKKDDQPSDFFPCTLYLSLDVHTGCLSFFNIDSLVGRPLSAAKLNYETNVNPLRTCDRFYGFGQGLLAMSKFYPLKCSPDLSRSE